MYQEAGPRRHLNSVVFAAAVVAISGLAYAAVSATTNPDQKPGHPAKIALGNQTAQALTLSPYSSMVSRLSAGHEKVLQSFPGPDGLTGLITGPVTGVGPKSIVWGLRGEDLVLGTVVSAQGKNLNLQAARTYHLLPKPMKSTTLALRMLSAPGFTVGKKGPLVAAFLDPNCIFCHLFWDQAMPLVQKGEFRLKVVPVGFLKPSSLPKAVTILMQKDPEQAWAANESGFNVKQEEGATVPAKKLNPQIRQEVLANTKLLSESGEEATPTVVMCAKAGEKPQVFHGFPRQDVDRLAHAASLLPTGKCGA